MNSPTVPDAPRGVRRSLACLTLLALSQPGWAGNANAPLHVRMTLVDRCDVRPRAGALPPEARCSAGVAKALARPDLPSGMPVPSGPQPVATATTSQPLPRDLPATRDTVAIVF